jgi:S-adenosylmethionine decarboxylase
MHITPEEHCSYVSFETDAPEKNYTELIQKILDLFKPKQFIVTFFANEVILFLFKLKFLLIFNCFLLLT